MNSINSTKGGHPMRTQIPNLLILGLVAAFGAGCASSPPTVGDRMISQSDSTRELGKRWEAGQSLVKKGESIKAEGQDIIAKGNEKVKHGDRLIAEGKAMMAESELLYKQRFPGKTLRPETAAESK